ncbi:MAG TPA: acetamidase/formamidase family protein [Solirubrobacteraceae bacterium]|nr:acetamidase/formamidase family protein [Solirubrobacteraceae bacterium]
MSATVHVLQSTPDTVSSGVLDPGRPVALTVDSGDVVSYPNTWTQWGNQATFGMSFADREPLRRQFPSGPYSNVGPVAVRGTEPGDVLECRMLSLRTIDWGWNSFPLGVGALPSDFDEPYVHYFRFGEDRRDAEFVNGIRIPLAPSMGVFAVEPAGEEPVSAILAGPYGGNLDLGELVAGTSLFLPVFKAGARVWTGDANAAQGDGVVDQTSIETAMEELRVQYSAHTGVTIAGPTIETPSHWIVMAFADSLDDALPDCVRTAIDWLNTQAGLDRRDAYALCSMAISFRVTQFADQTGSVYSSTPPRTIHAMIPKSVLGENVLSAIERSMRPGS